VQGEEGPSQITKPVRASLAFMDRHRGSAELLDEAALKIEFANHLGDEPALKAERATSSAAC
jgi:hypothetical protein